jgi:hypothetical protein
VSLCVNSMMDACGPVRPASNQAPLLLTRSDASSWCPTATRRLGAGIASLLNHMSNLVRQQPGPSPPWQVRTAELGGWPGAASTSCTIGWTMDGPTRAASLRTAVCHRWSQMPYGQRRATACAPWPARLEFG